MRENANIMVVCGLKWTNSPKCEYDRGLIIPGIYQLRRKSQVKKEKLWDGKKVYINCADRYSNVINCVRQSRRSIFKYVNMK